MSRQTRREADKMAQKYREQSCPACECRMCRRHRQAGHDSDNGAIEKKRQKSSVGEKLVGGLEKMYTVKRASRREGNGVDRVPDYGLPQLTTTSTISLPFVGQVSGPSSPTNPRQTYVRQNSDASRHSSIPHESVPLRSESILDSEAPLLGSSSSEPFQSHETLASEPADDHQDMTELQELTAPARLRASSTGYEPLPSR